MYSHFHGILRNTIKETYEKKSEKKIIKNRSRKHNVNMSRMTTL